MLILFVLGLLQTEFQIFDLSNQTVLLQLHEHLLFDSCFVFGGVSIEFGLQLLVSLFVLNCVVVKLLLLLLHSTMVDLLEVSLLAKFVVSRSRFLSNDACLVEFLLQHSEFVGQLRVLFVNCRHIWQRAGVKLPIGFQFVPLLLEALKGPFYVEFDEEVAKELIRLLIFL